MKLVLATNNKHKIREISALLDGLDIQILTKDDFADFPDVDETGTTLEANAELKARAIYEFTRLPSLADDSGLEVDHLNGAPGVYSARYAGEGCTFEDNNRKLLGELDGVPAEKRSARFRCVIAIAFDGSNVRLAEGRVDGRITTANQGKDGFGYDPVFEVPELGKTFAELSAEHKNRISHRGLALEVAKKLLAEFVEA